jgi:hypothetical protein
MSMYRNAGTENVAFRDDTGKHIIAPGQTFEVAGDQHLPHVTSLAGVEPDEDDADGGEPDGAVDEIAALTVADLRARLAEHGVEVLGRPNRAALEASYREALANGTPTGTGTEPADESSVD